MNKKTMEEAQALCIAIAMLNLTPSTDCTLFGVTRQTLSKWMKGETPAPREAFSFLLGRVIDAVTQGKANYAAAERARREAEERANLKAEEEAREKAASEEHIAEALKRINLNGEKK